MTECTKVKFAGLCSQQKKTMKEKGKELIGLFNLAPGLREVLTRELPEFAEGKIDPFY